MLIVGIVLQLNADDRTLALVAIPALVTASTLGIPTSIRTIRSFMATSSLPMQPYDKLGSRSLSACEGGERVSGGSCSAH